MVGFYCDSSRNQNRIWDGRKGFYTLYKVVVFFQSFCLLILISWISFKFVYYVSSSISSLISLKGWLDDIKVELKRIQLTSRKISLMNGTSKNCTTISTHFTSHVIRHYVLQECFRDGFMSLYSTPVETLQEVDFVSDTVCTPDESVLPLRLPQIVLRNGGHTTDLSE